VRQNLMPLHARRCRCNAVFLIVGQHAVGWGVARIGASSMRPLHGLMTVSVVSSPMGGPAGG